MRTARSAQPSDRFLGVRLTLEEVEALERFRAETKSPSRSEAVRALVRTAAKARPSALELPVGLQSALETIVEDGWARTLDEALTLVLTLGLSELSRVHGERLPALRRSARESADRRASRNRAGREGRGLLER